MNEGINLLVLPASDLAGTKAVISALLGVDPYADTPYYVGFRVGGLEVGLDPHGTSPIAYRDVADIESGLADLMAAGATLVAGAHDVGGGKLVATVQDPSGNVVGLSQNP